MKYKKSRSDQEMGKEETRKRQKLAYNTRCQGSLGKKKVELSKCRILSKVMLSNDNNAMYPFQKKYQLFAEQMSNAEQSGLAFVP